MKPKNINVNNGPYEEIKMGPSVLVRTAFANKNPFSGPIVDAKHVSTG